MATTILKRNIFQRMLGIPATKTPANAGCWRYSDGIVTVDLNGAPELNAPWGAICLGDDTLPDRVLVFRDDEDQFHAVQNRCSHAGRRLDPVPGQEAVQCCSIGKSTYNVADGSVVSGSAQEPIKIYAVEQQGGTLTIDI